MCFADLLSLWGGQRRGGVDQQDKGIRRPTKVRVDREGRRLIVINKDEREIRIYNLTSVSLVTVNSVLCLGVRTEM